MFLLETLNFKNLNKDYNSILKIIYIENIQKSKRQLLYAQPLNRRNTIQQKF